MKQIYGWVCLRLVFGAAAIFASACSRKAEPSATSVQPAKHEHHAPHGGTPVVLGDEAYHLELLIDRSSGELQVFVLDGEMENFIRCPMPAFDIEATVDGEKRVLTLKAIGDSATGETVGDTSFFRAQADWLKTTPGFDGMVPSIEIKGTRFTGVKFNYPKGNDHE
jgi:hypothetical protein